MSRCGHHIRGRAASPSVVLGASDGEVNGAIGGDVQVIGERERHSLGVVCEDLGLAALGPDDHQSEVRVAEVEVARLGVEAESQGASTYVL